MENHSGIPPNYDLFRRLVRWWLNFKGRKIRVLRAQEIPPQGPAVFAAAHPAGLFQALVMTAAMESPVRCMLPARRVQGNVAGFLARNLGFILSEADGATSDAALGQAMEVLANGGAVAVFTDAGADNQGSPGRLTTATALALHTERRSGQAPVKIIPVHLFCPEEVADAREVLLYLDRPLAAPSDTALSPAEQTQALMAELAERFQQNAFQLQAMDLDYFLTDLEDVLRAGLAEDWAARAEWKQDVEGFVLSRSVAEWAEQINHLHPGRLVALRKSLDDYRHLKQQSSLREHEIAEADSSLRSGGRRILVWAETVVGLPIALYGLLNYLLIGLVLLVTSAFRRENARSPSREWIIRGAVVLAFYALQIYLVYHWRGRAAAGYYAPTLPISGAYLWRYLGLVRPQARLVFISLTIPALARKIGRLRHDVLKQIDEALEGGN